MVRSVLNEFRGRRLTMIINISGASSTGKTTLVHDLYKRHEELREILKVRNIIPIYESVREVFQSSYSDKYKSLDELLQSPEATIHFHSAVADDQYQRLQVYADDPNRLYICDRGPLDTAVYLTLNYNRFMQRGRLNKSLDLLTLMTLELLKTLHSQSRAITFRTLPFEEIEDDGFRAEIYKTIRDEEVELFNDTFATSPVLPSGREERVEFILDYLRGVKRIGTNKPELRMQI